VFQTNPVVQTAKTNLITLGMSAHYGDSFSFDELKITAGVNETKDIYALIDPVNNTLLEHNRMFLNIRSVGYKIAEPREHTIVVGQKRQRAVRQLRKGVKVGNSTELSALTAEEQSTHINLVAKIHWGLKQVLGPSKKALAEQEKSLKAQQVAIDSQKNTIGRLQQMESDLQQLKKKIEKSES